MRSDTDTIKERLDIADLARNYIKLEKAGANWKARCPFHTEKTPSFFISPARQSYYCFGCGAKGDIFTLVEEMEGLEFREALKFLADKAGIELSYTSGESKTEKQSIENALTDATKFFEEELARHKPAQEYLDSRGVSEESKKKWRLGYAPAEWRSLHTYLLGLGHTSDICLKAGLIKRSEEKGGEPYDVFRGRVMFPLFDTGGRVIAFSGRALEKDTEPKYLNSPDTVLFHKNSVLYGLDKAKESIRRKDYAVLVEGQMDLVLSHQVGVENVVASSGTAFTELHLGRLKRLSDRVILAFDGDEAGEKAAEKSTILALSLGLEVKVAKLPEGKDPADLAQENPEAWKNVLRESKPAIEHFLDRVLESEPDPRKAGKLIGKKILPLIVLLHSAMERAHFVSLLAKRTGMKETLIWEDLSKTQSPISLSTPPREEDGDSKEEKPLSYREKVQERLREIQEWKKEMSQTGDKEMQKELEEEEQELTRNLSKEDVRSELGRLSVELARAEGAKDAEAVERLGREIREVHERFRKLEESRTIL